MSTKETERIKYKNRKQWLSQRHKRIGASEAAAVIGMSKWQSNYDLWLIKTERKQAEDISDNEAVKFGTEAEKYIRGLYELLNPGNTVIHNPYDVVYRKDRPWLAATLDGEITDKDGRNGILEIKTVMINTKAQAEEWKDRIKDQYYVQLLHQFLATGYEFADLCALLRYWDGDCKIKTYHIERAEVIAEMEWLLSEETKFWNENVKADKAPARLLPEI